MGFKLTLFCIIGIILSINTATAIQYPSEKPSVDLGQKIYTMNCAGCHGIKGDGSVFKGAPDFTNQDTMINKNSSLFFDAVSEGVPGTAMPGFGSLSVSEMWDVVAYTWTFWADRDSAGRGKIIYESKCAGCHGIKGDGSADARDFTKPENMVKTPSVLFNSVSEGIPNSAMRPWKSVLSENERWDAVKYVWSFQFKEYIADASSDQTKSTPVGNDLILISFALAICMVYLSGKRK